MPLTRRSFIGLTAPLLWYSCISRKANTKKEPEQFIMTVNGAVESDLIGTTLPHEHLFSIFGLDAEERTDYNKDELLSTVLPFLQKAKGAGCTTIIDCTATHFGRAPELLKTLSQKSGLHILTNTGIYGAAGGRYIPPYAYTETAKEIAKRWISEWETGIGNTGIRPGFIKLGINSGPLSLVDKKLVAAAAITHLTTGLTIAVHTGDNTEAAFEQLGILKETGVAPSAWIWTHAHAVPQNEPLVKAAHMGAWISFDGYRVNRQERFVEGIKAMKEAGYLHRILLSHDGNSYPQKGKVPATASLLLFTELLPALRKVGFKKRDINEMTITNPSKAFGVRVRRL